MYKEIIALGTGLRGSIISMAAIFVAAVVIVLPLAAVYAASSPYSFTMTYSVVDGCENGQFKTLDAGTAKLTGSTYGYASTIPVKYELSRDVFGPNPSYGTVNGGINTSFSNLAFSGSVPSASNFCIIAYRNGFDTITITGSGTLHN